MISMNVLTIFEQRISAIFEEDAPGQRKPFSFKRLAKRAVREMEDETFVIDGVDTAPALYTVLVSATDDELMRPMYARICEEISQLVEAQAKKRGYTFVGRPLVRFMVDPALRKGRFSVFAENVDPRTLERLRDEENAYLGLVPPKDLPFGQGFVPEQVPVIEMEPAPIASEVAYVGNTMEPELEEPIEYEPEQLPDDVLIDEPEEAFEEEPELVTADEPEADAAANQDMAPASDVYADAEYEVLSDVADAEDTTSANDEPSEERADGWIEDEDVIEFDDADSITDDENLAEARDVAAQDATTQDESPEEQASVPLTLPRTRSGAHFRFEPEDEPVEESDEDLLLDDSPEDDLELDEDSQPVEEEPVDYEDVFSAAHSAPAPTPMPMPDLQHIAPVHRQHDTCTLTDVATGRTYHIVVRRTPIGRERVEGGIVLRDPNVSRRHAELLFVDGVWLIRDLNSTNGTLVDDMDVREAVLANGDVITIGLTNLEFKAG